ncbi:MAG: aminotransferase [Phycisphaerae bacterium]|nr:MAG: aminotransferase [Phycisphaerae bacterium]
MIAYLHDTLVPLDHARISPLDRGFLFGDGLYEGLRAFDGRVVALDRHAARLAAGLREARIPFDASRLADLCACLLDANRLRDAFLYVQVTRGSPAPHHPPRSRLPAENLPPTVFAFATPTPSLAHYAAVPAKHCISTPDTRWLRGHVKSISLMGGILAGYEAHEAGADDAILVRAMPDGRAYAAESTSANLLIVTPHGEIVTPPLDHAPILAGVTRDLLLDAARAAGLTITQRPIPREELADAREVLLCGTLTMVTAVTHLDGHPVGEGHPGPVATRLLDLLCRTIAAGE